MSVTVKIFTRAGGRPTLYASRTLDISPISIGRDDACTIMLDDPHKHISRFHVEIEQEGSAYWMSVVSKVNPVMVKGRRYGPATRLTMKSGDAFEIGEYEVQVLLPDPAEEAKVFEEPTYVGPPRDADTEAPAPAAEARPAAAGAPDAAAEGVLRAFFEGAGVPQKALSAAQSERLMRDCGAVLRAAMEGIMMLLIARAEMLRGRKFTFDEESNALYDAVAPTHSEAYFQNVTAQLERELPGSGPLIERLEAFRRDFVIPKDKLDVVFQRAVRSPCHAKPSSSFDADRPIDGPRTILLHRVVALWSGRCRHPPPYASALCPPPRRARVRAISDAHPCAFR